MTRKRGRPAGSIRSRLGQLALETGIPYQTLWYRLMRLNDRCVRCAQPAHGNGSRCQDCASRERAQYRHRVGRPLKFTQRCSACGGDDHTLASCRRVRAARMARKERGAA